MKKRMNQSINQSINQPTNQSSKQASNRWYEQINNFFNEWKNDEKSQTHANYLHSISIDITGPRSTEVHNNSTFWDVVRSID